MNHQDRLTGETIAALRETPQFRGATVAEVVPLHQRSLCFRLRFADGRRVFVKSAVPLTTGGAHGSVAHEAAVLSLLHPLGLPVPRPIATMSGSAATVLVTEDVADRATLPQARAAAGGTSPSWAGAAGRGLARVHAAQGGTPDRLPRTDPVRRLLHTWTVVTPRDVTLHADGYGEFLRWLRCTGLVEVLEEAASGWIGSTLIHGDVAGDNVRCEGDPATPRAVCLVNWEAAGRGDPRWDVGCLIADYVYSWLARVDLDGGWGFDAWTLPADPPFSAVREEISAAVSAYVELRAVSPGDRRQWIRYAGFSLLQRVASAAQHSTALPPRSLAYLQVAAQLLRRPELSGELLLCP